MKFIHRLGYYLGGFSLGLILLAFFLSGKKTSCDYGPNARTIKNINIKKHSFSETSLANMNTYGIDSIEVERLIRTGDVNFSESDTEKDSCKRYLIENELKDSDIELWLTNCDSLVTIESLNLK